MAVLYPTWLYCISKESITLAESFISLKDSIKIIKKVLFLFRKYYLHWKFYFFKRKYYDNKVLNIEDESLLLCLQIKTLRTLKLLTVCSYHVTYKFQSESTLYKNDNKSKNPTGDLSIINRRVYIWHCLLIFFPSK